MKKGKKWIPSLQKWSWIVTVTWMVIANIWHPFGLFGFVCMFTPIIIALSGKGKMHCARVCPRGSFINTINKPIHRGLKRPAVFGKKGFRFGVWAAMMGSFAVVLVIFIPKGVDALGYAILVFMEVATAIALITGFLFQPRTWCTVCPMGFTTGNLKKLVGEKNS